MTAISALLLASLIYYFGYPEVDPDLWGHLFFGKEILQRVSLPGANIYSYTAPEHLWINHEWLAEVVFYGIYQFLGSPGLIVLKLALGCGVIWLLDRALRREACSVWVRALGLVWVMAMLSPGFNVRPQIFTYLLFAALLETLYRYKAGRRKSIYWVPVMMILWVNLHGGFAAGMGATGVFFLAHLAATMRRHEPIRLILIRLGIPLLATAIALLVNPYGLKLLEFIARDLLLERPITEWEPVALLDFSFLEFKLAVLVFLIFALWNRAWRRWNMIVALLAGLFALRHQRHIPLFAIVAAPVLAAGLERGFRWLRPRVREGILVFIIVAVAAYQWTVVGKTLILNRFQLVVNPLEYPTQAVDFLRRNGVRGNLAAPFDWGEYLIWKLYPDIRVSIDGRYTTAYPLETIEDNLDWMRGSNNWRKLLDQYPTQIAITHRNHPVTTLMRNDPKWIYIYSDPIAFIFVRDGPAQADLLEKFRDKRLRPPLRSAIFFPG